VEHIFSLRGVEDVVERTERNGEPDDELLGTKVSKRILSRDKDTLFPLQGVLGFDMAQTLFVGPYVVVVEGPSERAYFDWFSRELVRRGREGLDIRWAICPAEGASKITSFVTLFSGRGLKIAVVADYHEGQKKLIDALDGSGLLESSHLLKTSTYVGREDSDIEDMIGRAMYVDLIGQCLDLQDRHRLLVQKPADADDRVVKEVEAYCRLLPVGYPEFDHYLPAEFLQGMSESEFSLLPGLDEALTRFQSLFHDLNALIPSPAKSP